MVMPAICADARHRRSLLKPGTSLGASRFSAADIAALTFAGNQPLEEPALLPLQVCCQQRPNKTLHNP
jgi:hypothetical protein